MQKKATFEGLRDYLIPKQDNVFCYTDLIERGFIRVDVDDNVHYNDYGYQDFFLLKALSKKRGIYMYWNPQSSEVKAYKEAKNGEELCLRYLNSLDEIDFYISLFEK